MRQSTEKGTKDAFINTRVEQETKDKVERVLKKIGLSPADAVRLLFAQIILQKGLPFAVKIPNQQTVQAIEDIETGNTFETRSGREILED